MPLCDCGRPLKPDVVLFGEFLAEAALARATALAEGADLLLCIGSSLEVHPVAQLPAVTLRRGGAIAIVTQGPTPYDARAAVRLSGDVEAELRRSSPRARHRRRRSLVRVRRGVVADTLPMRASAPSPRRSIA